MQPPVLLVCQVNFTKAADMCSGVGNARGKLHRAPRDQNTRGVMILFTFGSHCHWLWFMHFTSGNDHVSECYLMYLFLLIST